MRGILPVHAMGTRALAECAAHARERALYIRIEPNYFVFFSAAFFDPREQLAPAKKALATKPLAPVNKALATKPAPAPVN